MIEIPLGSALLAGFLTFLAPCTLPLVPAFLGYLAGTSDNPTRRALIKITAGFTFGFSVVFIFFGLAAGLLGTTLLQHQDILTKIGGVIVVFMGLVLVFKGKLPNFLPTLSRPVGFRVPKIFKGEASFYSSLVTGVSFGFGFSPCLGPILGGILTIAATSGDVLQSTLLLALYSLGLAVPFFVLALFYKTLSAKLVATSPQLLDGIRIFGGLLFIALGVLLFTNSFGLITEIGTKIVEPLYFNKLFNYL